jgi:hypothetical protein
VLVGWSNSSGAGDKRLECVKFQLAGQSFLKKFELIDYGAFFINFKEDNSQYILGLCFTLIREQSHAFQETAVVNFWVLYVLFKSLSSCCEWKCDSIRVPLIYHKFNQPNEELLPSGAK